jgi:DNA-binding CsgD family transcriptional regulator
MPAIPAVTANVRTTASREVSLSPRECEVLALMEKGFTAGETADLMRVSRHTVVTFVRRLYLKLDVCSKAEAIFEARSLGLLQA